MVTLFTKIKELAKMGEITWEPFFRPDTGPGERPMHKGSRTRVIAGFVGNTRNIHPGGESTQTSFTEPHDLLINESTGELIAFAYSG